MDSQNVIKTLRIIGRHSCVGLTIGLLLVASLGMASRQSIQEGGTIRVVTSIPDLADLTSRIGGKLVSVESLAKGLEDPHGVPIKPSFLPKLNRADVLVVMGLAHEHAWLNALVQTARNPNILPGNPGLIDCSLHIAPKQIPLTLSRREGDLHPQGNPHYNLDPLNAILMAQAIAEGLSRVYPTGQSAFEANFKKFQAHLTQRIVEWQTLAKSFRGVKFVSYHQDTIYFAERFGLIEAGHIEIRPGIEPTQRHLISLVNTMKKEGVTLILREPYFGEQLPNWVAQQTGARVAKFLIMVGGNSGVKTYEDLIDFNLRSIQQAIQSVNQEHS
ncbi:MAG: zinc ABC transporter substrate-binding protein [Nitrospirales bacterium]|nr:zinc ABC transporter substrate-binding protein [Nitrospirales bacterium]